jgi:hypothetical protein
MANPAAKDKRQRRSKAANQAQPQMVERAIHLIALGRYTPSFAGVDSFANKDSGTHELATLRCPSLVDDVEPNRHVNDVLNR